MVEYCRRILDNEGRKCFNPFYVRGSIDGEITEVYPYPEDVDASSSDNTATDDIESPEKISNNATAGGPALARCENTNPTTGNDDWLITQVDGSNCATLTYMSDYRTGGGDLMDYSTEVKDSETCYSTYKWKHNWSTLSSGSCQSYYVSEGVACLSSCHDNYDCYVSSEEVVLNAMSCAAAAGVEEALAEEDTPAPVCYEYNYSKGPFREEAPNERKCDSSCFSLESTLNDATISIGGCTSGMDNFCSERNGNGDLTKCVECIGYLCNPVYSYNGSSSRRNGVGVVFTVALLLMWQI
ncbi:hypothetical protein ACHAXR_009910 [Thalassiosira sp. AJA248-18]